MSNKQKIADILERLDILEGEVFGDVTVKPKKLTKRPVYKVGDRVLIDDLFGLTNDDDTVEIVEVRDDNFYKVRAERVMHVSDFEEGAT